MSAALASFHITVGTKKFEEFLRSTFKFQMNKNSALATYVFFMDTRVPYGKDICGSETVDIDSQISIFTAPFNPYFILKQEP